MKYLKTYNIFESFGGFEKGDYVWVTSDYFEIKDIPCVVDAEVEEDVYVVIPLDGSTIDGEVNNTELRKMKDYEIATYKFNL